MRKKGLLFLSLFLILSLSLIQLVASQNETEQEKIDNAYECLNDKVSGNCATLSSEEKAFSALAAGSCRGDLTSDPKWKNDVKYTAQAVLALKGNSDGENWLLSRNATPSELTWFLEIETINASSCTIQYSGQSFTVNIGKDKKLSSGAGSCLTLAQDDYWLRVSPSCFNTEFSISCNQGFLTTLLFKKTTSSTIHVLEDTSSAAAGGTTKEKVESSCFTNGQGSSCNYESTLWAAFVLDSVDEDVSAYLPYLTALADENERFLPEAFLYALTGNTEFKTALLSKQKNSQWWEESGDKFYDTALALYPLRSETPQEKTNAKNWLLDVQDENGCWEDNIRNTAFILASIFPRQVGGAGDGLPDCEDAGYFCTTASQCDGTILAEFDCPSSLYRCCTTPVVIETCSEQGGDICSSNEICAAGTTVDASDLRTGELCCVGGTCRTAQTTECASSGGTCRSFECESNEQQTSASCEFSADVCCIQKPEGRSYWWIWLLLVLIIIVVLAIIFRDKLRRLWHGMRGKPKPGPMPPRGPPYFPGYQPRPQIMHRPPERRILVPSAQPSLRKEITKIKSGAEKELDEVLKKLKEMSK